MYDVYDAHAYTHEYGHDVCTLNTVFSFFFLFFTLPSRMVPRESQNSNCKKKKKCNINKTSNGIDTNCFRVQLFIEH